MAKFGSYGLPSNIDLAKLKRDGYFVAGNLKMNLVSGFVF